MTARSPRAASPSSLGLVFSNVALFLALLGWLVVSYVANPPVVPVIQVPASFVRAWESRELAVEMSGDPDALEENALDAAAEDALHPLHEEARRVFREGRVEVAVALLREAMLESPADARLRNDLGVYELSRGAHREALAAFEQATRLDPSYSRAFYNLGTLLLKQGQPVAAVAPLERALEIHPYYREARFNLAQSLSRIGRPAQAMREYEAIIRSDNGPRSVRAHNHLGLLLAAEGRLREALASFTAALRLRPDYNEARFNKALLLSRMDLVEKAEREYGRLLELEPGHTRALVNLGVLRMREERWEEAAEHFRRAIAGNPGNPNAHYNLGLCFVRRGDDERAAAEFEAALGHLPEFAEAAYNLGLAFRRLGRLEESVSRFERAVALRPDAPTYRYNLALALADAGAAERATEEYQAALRLRPDYFEARYNLALTHYRRESYESARAVFEKAREQRPDSYEASYNLGLTLLKLGRDEEAEREFRVALGLEETLEAHYNLGLAISRQGRDRKAAEQFAAALRLDPKHARSIERIAEIESAQGRHESALRHLALLQKLVPSDPTAFNTGLRLYREDEHALAARYFAVSSAGAGALRPKSLVMQGLAIREEEPEQAEQRLREAIALSETHEAHYNLGLVVADQGRPAEAMEHYEAALALHPTHRRSLEKLADAALELGNHEKALHSLGVLQELDPEDASAYNHGLDLYRGGEYAEAGRYLAVSATGSARLREKSLNMAGLALAKQGRLADAVAQLEEADREFPDSDRIRKNLRWVRKQQEAAAIDVPADAAP